METEKKLCWTALGKPEEIIVEAVFPQSGSHQGLEKKLSQAIDGKVQSGADMDVDGDDDSQDRKSAGYPLHYVNAVHDKHVIYSMNGKTFAHGYNQDEQGDPHLKGNPKEVEPSYQSVKANESVQESFSESLGFSNEVTFAEANGYDAAKGELTITVIKPGWSGNNRYYSPEMLKRDYKVFEGARMFANHQTDRESAARPEGSVNDWVGSVKNVWAESDGTVRGKAAVIDEGFKTKLANLKEHDLLKSMGVSICAAGKASDGEVAGRRGRIIEGITKARSVDFVTFAGAGGQVETLN